MKLMVLNEDIHEFDKMEERIIKKTKKQLHTFFQYLKKLAYLIDAKLFETTYKEEYEKQNILIDKQNAKIIKLKKELKKYEKEDLGT